MNAEKVQEYMGRIRALQSIKAEVRKKSPESDRVTVFMAGGFTGENDNATHALANDLNVAIDKVVASRVEFYKNKAREEIGE